MIKKNIKLLLTTIILSTQLYLNAFAMGKDTSDDPQGPPPPIQTRKPKDDATPNHQFQYELEGRQILNQQPYYNPNNNPQNLTIPKEQLKKKKSDN